MRAPLLLVPVLAACATAPRASVPDPGGCLIADTPARPLLRIALGDSIDPAHAPTPRNEAEALVFAQLYDTLVRVDCTGAVFPGLAESWTPRQDGTWTFILADDAQFADGTPVTARAVVDAWSSSADAPALEWVSASGEREVHVAPVALVRDARYFAQPSLAIVKPVDDGWPVGTRPYHPETSASGAIRLVRNALAGAPDTLVLDVVAGDDPRLALDRGADVLVTRDASVVAYARALPDYTVLPLPWSRTYALVVAALQGQTTAATPDSVRRALARDAAPEGTRAAVAALAYDTACTATAPAIPSAPVRGTSAHAIAFARGDAAARNLAERIAALAWPPQRVPSWLEAVLPRIAGGRAPTTAALDGDALAQALDTGRYFAYVVALPPVPSAPCAAGGAIAPVLRALREATAGGRLHVIPLVDGRDYLIRRDAIGRVLIDAAGTIRFGVQP